MKRIFMSPNVAEVSLLQSLLEAEGVACMIRNDQISSVSAMPMASMFPELWVNDDDQARAEQLVARWNEESETTDAPWICATCGEENEGQFGACWKCGEPINEDQ